MAQLAKRIQPDRLRQLHEVALAALEIAHVPVEEQVLRRGVRVQAGTQLIELHGWHLLEIVIAFARSAWNDVWTLRVTTE